MESRWYYLISYVNHKGGINNLQVAKVCEHGVPGYFKIFTSQKNLAEGRAKDWIRKEDKAEIELEKKKQAGVIV